VQDFVNKMFHATDMYQFLMNSLQIESIKNSLHGTSISVALSLILPVFLLLASVLTMYKIITGGKILADWIRIAVVLVLFAIMDLIFGGIGFLSSSVASAVGDSNPKYNTKTIRAMWLASAGKLLSYGKFAEKKFDLTGHMSEYIQKLDTVTNRDLMNSMSLSEKKSAKIDLINASISLETATRDFGNQTVAGFMARAFSSSLTEPVAVFYLLAPGAAGPSLFLTYIFVTMFRYIPALIIYLLIAIIAGMNVLVIAAEALLYILAPISFALSVFEPFKTTFPRIIGSYVLVALWRVSISIMEACTGPLAEETMRFCTNITSSDVFVGVMPFLYSIISMTLFLSAIKITNLYVSYEGYGDELIFGAINALHHNAERTGMMTMSPIMGATSLAAKGVTAGASIASQSGGGGG